MYQALLDKEKKIGVIGLGYVGLPLALEFAKYFSVIGFDINSERVEMMQNKIDPSNELAAADFENKDIVFTDNLDVLREANFYIIAVPTDIDEHKVPNLRPLQGASATVGKVIKKGDYVVYESTVYPGCTEEDCVPIVEEISGLKAYTDFKVGYSPERINPGDKEHTVAKILKIVAGNDDEALQTVADVYGKAIIAGVYKAQSIRVAEAAKVIENSQRDINIAFVNELSMIFDKMNLDTKAVLEAAGTKWNFLKFQPGLVGGHCIGVDPYYLAYKAQELGYNPEVILSGRRINDNMPAYIAKRLVQMIIQKGKNPGQTKVLVMGLTFKENVSDIRNSKVVNIIKELMGYSVNVHIVDPYASPNEVAHEYKLTLLEKPNNDYDAVIVAVAHDKFKEKYVKEMQQLLTKDAIFFDLKAIYQPAQFEDNITYWRL
ncbi:MAG: nucleotide sugar dehydrogenase [Saprospiraceae bacterium]|nr:nucleotide sugar dehydrogenase [Saprospiraceae bacterium]MBP7699035.1 nucleotide sugar dehydrogenase [Saprospiraceae bacterium]